MNEREVKEQEIVKQEDKQTKKEEIKEEKKEEIKEEKSDLMVIVEAITKGFEILGNKIDTGFETLGKKIDTGFENLGKKIDTGFGELKDVFKKYMSRENEWTLLKLHLDEIKKTLKDELKLENYSLHIESEQEGADFLIKVKERNETKEEIKAYIIVEVKEFPSNDNIKKAYEQIEKVYDNITQKEITKTIQEETIKIPIIGAILFRFWRETPEELKEIAYGIIKEGMNKFYDFHIGYFYNNRYNKISLKEEK